MSTTISQQIRDTVLTTNSRRPVSFGRNVSRNSFLCYRAPTAAFWPAPAPAPSIALNMPRSGWRVNSEYGPLLPGSKNVRLLGSPSRHGDHLSASPYPLLTDPTAVQSPKEDVSPLLQEDDQKIFRRSGHCFRGNTPPNAEWWTLSARHTILTTREFPSPPHLRDNDNPARWEL